MFWTIAVGLIVLWMLGLATGFTLGSLIHLLYVAAVGLLVVSLSQEVAIDRKSVVLGNIVVVGGRRMI